jgi:hypothetical protein
MMIRISLGRSLTLLMLAAGVFAATAQAASKLDLADPVQALDAYVRANGDTSGKPVATWATGVVYAYVPGDRPRPVFGLEVLGMSRFLKIDGGYQRLHKEVGYYTDLQTGKVIDRWFNPWLQREVEVVHIQNDPVNRKFLTSRINFKINEAGDEIAFYREVPLRYPNPLDRANYPLYSSGDFYEAIEMFNTFARRHELENRRLTSVSSTGSWSRLGPWLPWMEMGAHQGYLLYHSRALKPAEGLAALPASLVDEVRRRHPSYLEAPTELREPDETSWTFFKKLIDERRRASGGGR